MDSRPSTTQPQTQLLGIYPQYTVKASKPVPEMSNPACINGHPVWKGGGTVLASLREVVFKGAALPFVHEDPQGAAGRKSSKGISWRSCFHPHSSALPENVAQSRWHHPSFPTSLFTAGLLPLCRRPTSPSSRIWLWCSVPKCQDVWAPKSGPWRLLLATL